MDFDGFDQTQAIAFDDYSDDTDDLGDPENKQPVGYLKVFSQKSFNETSFPVFEGDNFIGRHESNQICIPLKALSKKHACIEIQGDSHLIYDLESRNKTRRGKLFLKPSVRYELHGDDSLIFGDVTCQFIQVEIQKKSIMESDDGSETDSELMFQDLPVVGEKTGSKREPDFGSSSSYDFIQPTQAYGAAEIEKKMLLETPQSEKKILLETPQRGSATLIFAESSDENLPTEPVKALADSSISHGSIAETPGSKPLAESTVINDSFDEEYNEKTRHSDLDISTLALAPTQAYGQFAEQETQAYPMDDDSDPEDDGEVRQSLFDAPTQAFSVPDSEEEKDSRTNKPTPRSNKRISLEPTLLLNISTDDETSIIKEPRGTCKPPYHQDIAEEATLAYNDSAASDNEECPQETNNESASTLAFADLATQAYCTEEENEEADGVVNALSHKEAQTLEPTLKYDMQQENLQDINVNQADAATLRYAAETESDTDNEREQGVEPTLKYNMGVEGGQEKQGGQSGEGVCLAMEPTLAYTAEEDHDESMDISALAVAETQAYATPDSDSDNEEVKSINKPIKPKAATLSSVRPDNVDEPTLAYDDHDGTSKSMSANHCDEATLAYSNNDDDTMDTEMSLDEEEPRGMGYEEMATQPADGMETEPGSLCDPNAQTLQYNSAENEDDTTAATQAYCADPEDDEQPPPSNDQEPSTSISEQQATTRPDVKDGGMDGRKEGAIDAEMSQGGGGGEESEANDDFLLATQVYGADEEGDTQVPDSQEGAEEENQPLAGINHRVSSMLRKVPERSAMASPEKKPHQRVRKVAFKEQTPPYVEVSKQEEKNTTRKSARGRKPKVKDHPPPRFTETDAKPTRRKSKDLRFPKDVEEADNAPYPRKASKSKGKRTQDVVEGDVKSVDGDSEESMLELKEDEGMVWKSTEGVQPSEINNNILSKPAARKTTRRQASYKKAVHGEDSDDTESMSSTSSLQVGVVEPARSSDLTVCDGKQSKDVVKPRRGRRSNASKEAASKEAASKETAYKVADMSSGKGKSSALQITEPEVSKPAGTRQTRRSVVLVSKMESDKSTKLKSAQCLQENESGKLPELKESSEDISSSSTGTRSSRGRKTSSDIKGTPASTRRGRKPKAVAKISQTKGQKQSSITEYACVMVEDIGSTFGVGCNAIVEDKQSTKTDSLESSESLTLLSTETHTAGTTARSRRTRTASAETDSKPSTQPAAKHETFLAPEPVKRGGRKRRGTKEEDQSQGSVASLADPSPSETDTKVKKERLSQGKGGRKGRKSAVSEAPQKEKDQEPSAAPTNSRRGKRVATPTFSTPIGSPAKKVKAPETPEGEVASPSLRRRASDIKPKVMFTGVIDKSWQKIVTSLGGELVESVFDCTHLVTDKVRRTVKFLCCLSKGALIVIPEWLNQCKLIKSFIDPAPYLVMDKAAEKQHGFSHVTSHQRAQQGGVMTKYRIFVTGSVKPEPEHMKEIILCAGGKFLSSMPVKPDSYTVIVSCEADKAKCQPAVKAGLQIVSAEFILTGMLRQEIKPEFYQLFAPTPSTSERGTKRKVNDAPSHSKRKR